MATYRRRGKRVYAEVRKQGVYRSRTLRSKTAAREWAEGVEADIEAGSLGSQTLLVAFRRYADEVSSAKKGARWERIRLGLFERTMDFVRRPIAEITPDMIGAWRDSRLQDVSTSSVRRELVLLGGVFETARREWRWIRNNPVRDVRKPPSRPPREQTISDAQAGAIMDAAGYYRGMKICTTQQLMAAAFDLALETAMRAGEIRGLRGRDIDLKKRVATLPETKTGQRRQVPLSNGAVEILASLDPERPFPLSADTLASTFRRVRRKAGLEGEFTFHDSRASAITRLSKRLSIYDLARMTGHKNLGQLADYYRASASEIAHRLD